MRATRWSLTAVAVILSLGTASAQPITVVSSGGTVAEAQRKAFYEPFVKANPGTRIVEDSFAHELAKVRAQVDTRNVTWDVVTLTVINEATACEEGLVERVDWAKLLDAKLYADVGGFGQCGAPILVSTGALVYDADRIKDPPKSWADVWNVQKWPGKRALLYRAEQTLEVALMADGVEPRDVHRTLAAPGGVERAFAKLRELKPHIQWWRSGDEPLQLLAAGEVAMAYAWNGRVATANRTNKRNFRIVWDAGHVGGTIYFGVMKGSRQAELAQRFIAFAASAAPQAEIGRLLNFAPGNVAAYDLMSPEDTAYLPRGFGHRGAPQAGAVYTNFWLERGDALLQEFIKFAAQ